MKTLFLSVFLAAFVASATQRITCHQVDESGKRIIRGAALTAKFDFEKDRLSNASIDLRRLFKKGSGLGEQVTGISAYQTPARDRIQFTHVNFYDSTLEDIVYQLRFDERVLNRSFTNLAAELVVDLDLWSTDAPASGAGYNLICSSKAP